MRLLGTGVDLRLADAETWLGLGREHVSVSMRQLAQAVERGEKVIVECQVFAEIEDDGETRRAHGPTYTTECAVGADSTTALLELAEMGRHNLGDLLGDLRMRGYDVARWDFYAAPFRIELAEELRQSG